MRRLLQFTGPFEQGQSISVPARFGYEYVHIGIQTVKREPMYFNSEQNVKPDIQINDIAYVIPRTETLQFTGLAELEWNIVFLKNLPPETTIDISYDVSDN